MGKETALTHTYSRISFRPKKEGNFAICKTMNEPGGPSANVKIQTQENILQDLTWMWEEKSNMQKPREHSGWWWGGWPGAAVE